jgi:hypothetical protein
MQPQTVSQLGMLRQRFVQQPELATCVQMIAEQHWQHAWLAHCRLVISHRHIARPLLAYSAVPAMHTTHTHARMHAGCRARGCRLRCFAARCRRVVQTRLGIGHVHYCLTHPTAAPPTLCHRAADNLNSNRSIARSTASSHLGHKLTFCKRAGGAAMPPASAHTIYTKQHRSTSRQVDR